MRDLESAPAALTVAEAAEFLRKPKNTIYRWIRRKELPAARIGRCIWIARSEIEKRLAGDNPSTPGTPHKDGGC